MNLFARSALVLTAAVLLGSTLTATAQAPAAPAQPAAAKPAPDTAALLKQILDNQRAMETKIADIQKRLDSISTFLGDQRSSTFDTVDRRLRDIADDVKDLKR